MSDRWDSYCIVHTRYHNLSSGRRDDWHCRLLSDDLDALMNRLRGTRTEADADILSLKFNDFCHVCKEHEIYHVNRWCLTAATRFTVYAYRGRVDV